MHGLAHQLYGRQRGSLSIGAVSAITLIFILAGFVVAYQFVDPAPPDRIVLATGTEGGAYQRFGEQYASYLAESGVEVTLRETAGSMENLELLSTDSGVDIAFVQGGLAARARTEVVMAIGSLYLEPLWLFLRRDFEIDDMSDLAGARLSVGAEGSGTRVVASNLMAAHGVTEESATFMNVELDELGEEFVDGNLDFHLGNQVGCHHVAAIDFGVFLLPMSVDAGDGDAANFIGDERFAYFVEFVFLNDCGNQFHFKSPVVTN